MTKLSVNRDTPEIAGKNFAPLLKALEIVFAGGMAAVNVITGESEAAADAANLVVRGRFESYVDNTNDGLRAPIHAGVFRWNNSADHAVTAAYMDKKLYVEDDNTVSIDPGTHAVIAGIMVDLDSEGVWVDCRPAAMSAAIGANPVAAVVSAPAAITAANPAAITAANPAAITAANPAAITAAAANGGVTVDAEGRVEIAKLVTDLTASRAEVVKLVTDLTASRAEVVKTITDLTASRAEVVKTITDLTATRTAVTSILTALKNAGIMASS
jgi:hypothetical protein